MWVPLRQIRYLGTTPKYGPWYHGVLSFQFTISRVAYNVDVRPPRVGPPSGDKGGTIGAVNNDDDDDDDNECGPNAHQYVRGRRQGLVPQQPQGQCPKPRLRQVYRKFDIELPPVGIPVGIYTPLYQVLLAQGPPFDILESSSVGGQWAALQQQLQVTISIQLQVARERDTDREQVQDFIAE